MSKLSHVFQRTAQNLKQAAHRAALEELREDLAGPLSDTAIAIDEASASAAQNLAAVAQAVSEAQEYETDARNLRSVEMETSACRQAMEMVNNNGGFTLESLGYAHLALRAALAPVQVAPPLNAPALEAFADNGKQVLSLEGIDELLSQVEAVKGEVEAKSIDGILRVLEAIKSAAPEVKDRLVAMQQALPDVTYDENAQIRVDDLIFKALAVDGRLPTGFKDWAEGFAAFANTILSAFSENALVSAGKAGEIGSTIGGLAENACPIEALIKFIKEVGDPRDGIEADKLNYVLPGSGPLFGDAMAAVDPAASDDATDEAGTDEATNLVDNVPTAGVEDMGEEDPIKGELITRLTKFSETRVPLDPIGWAERADVAPDSSTIRVLSKDTIAGAVAALIKALDIVDAKTFGDANRQTWVQARSAFAAYQQGKNQLQAVQAAALSEIEGPLCTYLDTVFELSAWPALHVLTNLVFTANAFLLLAERSIAGETEQSPEEAGAAIPDETVPTDVQPEDETADEAGVTDAEPTAASTDAPVEDAAAGGVTVEPAPDTVPPATPEPVAEEPAATEPAAEPASEPAATEPTSTEPAAAEPTAAPAEEPVTEPAAAPAAEPAAEPAAAPAAEPATAPAEAGVTPPAEEEEEEEEDSTSTPGENA